LSLEGGDGLGYLAGQYVNVLVPGTDQRRSYSFSSTPGSAELSFLVRDISRGVMSNFLRENPTPGTPMVFIGPAGSFYLREIKRPLLFVAGATGLPIPVDARPDCRDRQRPLGPPDLRRDK
jgi:benzoate/toluate 1,2-dioxygenase reductase subunit